MSIINTCKKKLFYRTFYNRYSLALIKILIKLIVLLRLKKSILNLNVSILKQLLVKNVKNKLSIEKTFQKINYLAKYSKLVIR